MRTFHCHLQLQLCRYSIIVLVVECIGISAVVPYGLVNICHTHPTGSPGLPADDGTLLPDKTSALLPSPVELQFSMRVLVPCYAEPLSVVSATVTAAMEADLPPGVCVCAEVDVRVWDGCGSNSVALNKSAQPLCR